MEKYLIKKFINETSSVVLYAFQRLKNYCNRFYIKLYYNMHKTENKKLHTF